MAIRSRRRTVWLGVVALCLVQFVDVLGVTVVITALPDMLSDLGASESAASLIATGYAMCFGGLLMLGARLGDRYGHRRIILIGLAVFGVAAVVGATAGSVAVLTGSRCLQGAAAAMSVPSALRLLTTTTVAGPQRRNAVALWSAAGAAAGASGFVVGGVVTQLAGWRVVFWGYVPVAAALAVVIASVVTADDGRDLSIPLNLPGVVTFTLSVMLFVVATVLLPDRRYALLGVVLLIAAVVMAAVFVFVDRRARGALLPPGVLRQRPLRQGAVGAFLNTATTSSAITLVTLYLQDTRGLSALRTALLLVPFSLAVIVGAALAPPALARWRPQHVIAAGLAAITVFDAALILAARSSWLTPACMVLGGVGIGLSSVAATGLGTSVPVSARGTASGIINTAAQLGTAVGIAVVLLAAAVTTGLPAPATPVPSIAWGLAALTALAGSVTYALLGRRSSSDIPRAAAQAARSV